MRAVASSLAWPSRCSIYSHHSGASDRQRATYQPFNLIVLTLASIGMAIGGQMTMHVLWIAFLCLPATLIGAWLGAG